MCGLLYGLHPSFLIGGTAQTPASVRDTVKPLFAVTDQIRAAATCGFIGAFYIQVKKSVCKDFVGALTNIALCTFLIGILNFAVIVCSTMLSKRMPNPLSDNPEFGLEHLGIGGGGGGGGGGIDGRTVEASIEMGAFTTISPKRAH
jgi:hypothetical protein